MFEAKLQVGCLVVVCYIIFVYIKETTRRKISCNKLFDLLMIFSSWAIFFDGFTAWTVNHMDIVPSWINLSGHLLFFIFIDLFQITVFIYMIDLTLGLSRKWWKNCILLIPGAVSLVLICVFFPQLEFIHGETTWYSMGTSVIVCYISIILHTIITSVALIMHRKKVDKGKFIHCFIFMCISIVLLGIQASIPESLVSALYTTVIFVGIYIVQEDPFFRQVKEYNETMVTDFATLVENRDNSTGGHIKRTKLYVGLLLNKMKKTPEYRKIFTNEYISNVQNAAPLHDIGKIATPDSILQKPGKLTDEEYAIMKEHAAKGGEIIEETFSNLGDPDFEKIAYEVARYHHEKWNGRGYPEGISGEQIPLHARIMAVADVFDAVSAKRCYRDAMPMDQCFEIIEKGIGTDFDPTIARLFLDSREQVEEIFNNPI